MSPEGLFAQLLAREPGKPFVTYYDDSSGERSELSAKSAANWVAKTYHLLLELDLGVGDTAHVALPAHWISVPVLLGCLSAGLAITPSPGDAAVAFVDERSAHSAGDAPDVFAVATAGAARGFGSSPPPGAADYIAAVRPQPDSWTSVGFPATDADPCLPGRTRAQVSAQAGDRAAQLGLSAGARVLSTREWRDAQDWVDCLFAPLAVGGSVVYVRGGADQETLERRAAQERVTNRY